MLQLLLGGSGSGKTTLLYQRIRARAEKGEKSILLVPEQFTSSTEGRIYRELGDALSGMVESFSFTSLAEKILSTEGGAAVQTLSDAGRAVLVRRALEELQDKENRKLIRRLVAEVLTEREADIIRRRYGLDGRLPQTQKQVAALYGISRSYVSRIEKKALGKLEEALRGRVLEKSCSDFTLEKNISPISIMRSFRVIIAEYLRI